MIPVFLSLKGEYLANQGAPGRDIPVRFALAAERHYARLAMTNITHFLPEMSEWLTGIVA